MNYETESASLACEADCPDQIPCSEHFYSHRDLLTITSMITTTGTLIPITNHSIGKAVPGSVGVGLVVGVGPTVVGGSNSIESYTSMVSIAGPSAAENLKYPDVEYESS